MITNQQIFDRARIMASETYGAPYASLSPEQRGQLSNRAHKQLAAEQRTERDDVERGIIDLAGVVATEQAGNAEPITFPSRLLGFALDRLATDNLAALEQYAGRSAAEIRAELHATGAHNASVHPDCPTCDTIHPVAASEQRRARANLTARRS